MTPDNVVVAWPSSNDIISEYVKDTAMWLRINQVITDKDFNHDSISGFLYDLGHLGRHDENYQLMNLNLQKSKVTSQEGIVGTDYIVKINSSDFITQVVEEAHKYLTEEHGEIYTKPPEDLTGIKAINSEGRGHKRDSVKNMRKMAEVENSNLEIILQEMGKTFAEPRGLNNIYRIVQIKDLTSNKIFSGD